MARSLLGLARVALAQKRPRDAVPLAERAVGIRLAAGVPAIDLAEARLVLAQALVGAGEPVARAVALARQARDAYQEAGEASRDDLTEVDAFLREHARRR
jgi:hypothetical protein